ncbi:hypothetical protein RFI_34899 [Reticulomyxa filosa]|uniref:CAP-Gly domain-containing protein n=1 Tax=Reticulomyxa filosa TaxID=46433 RepID=X6LMD4_RETFI|nr:hypothetical protein RFI_34899 [Reticulomyxa filosa]|eukprot:ETO02526.1 hypothetical protein RFI_34899 [Reticulomyxa filosa]
MKEFRLLNTRSETSYCWRTASVLYTLLEMFIGVTVHMKLCVTEEKSDSHSQSKQNRQSKAKHVYVGLELCGKFYILFEVLKKKNVHILQKKKKNMHRSENGHDGLIDGVRYYVCEAGKGKMVPIDSVIRPFNNNNNNNNKQKELLDKVSKLNADLHRQRIETTQANDHVSHVTMKLSRLKNKIAIVYFMFCKCKCNCNCKKKK